MMKRQEGMTLLEVTITTALLASTLLVVMISYAAISRLQAKAATAQQTQQAGRYVLEQLARDVRNSASLQVTSLAGNPGACLLVTAGADSGGGTVAYSWDGSSTLYRSQGLGTSCSTTASSTNQPIAPTGTRITLANFQFLQSAEGKPMVLASLTVQQHDATLSLTNSYAFSYQLSTILTPREQG